jgi:purine nucleoside phosphorylase
MSTVHEVVAARHCGIKIVAFSLITNICEIDEGDDEDEDVDEVSDDVANGVDVERPGVNVIKLFFFVTDEG